MRLVDAEITRSLLIMLAACIAYSGTLDNGFTYDARGIVLENDLVRDGDPKAIFTTGYWSGSAGKTGGLFRPMTMASFRINFQLTGASPRAFHLVDLLLHAGAAVGLFLLGRGFLGTRGGVCAGFLFGLHPALSEAVLSVVGRAELLALWGGAIGVWSWKRSAHSHRWLLLCGSSLLAAQLAKESGICFALILSIYGLTVAPKNPLRWGTPLLAAGMGVGVKWLVTGTLGPPFIPFLDNPLAYAGDWLRVINGCRLLVKYIQLLVYPWPLAADYSYDQIPLVGEWHSAEGGMAILFLASLLFLGAMLVRRDGDSLIWGGASAIVLLMASHVWLPIGTLFAERLVYLPAAGFCLGTGWAMARIEGRKGIWLVAVWMVAAGGLIRQRVPDWQDDLSLFTRNVEVAGGSARSHYGLGWALQERGRWKEAIEAYDQALRILPRYPDAHYNRGTALLQLEEWEEALEAFRAAVDSRPGYLKAMYACALLEEKLGRVTQAQESYRRLLQWKPDHPAGRKGLKRLLSGQARSPGRVDQ